MKPYVYRDDLGKLVVSDGIECAVLEADCCIRIPRSEVPAAALALYEAAGLPAPLILDRPERTGGIEYAGAGDRYAFTSRAGAKVAIGWCGIEPGEFDPDEALEFAAHIAVNAQAVKRGEPTPVQVDELADLIRAEDHDLGYEYRRGLARAILLGGWKREPEQ